MRVLAIDASLRNTGVAIVDANNGKPQSVYFGTIHNKSAMRPASCLVCIRDQLAELIREHAPDCCALSRSFTCRAIRPPSFSARRAAQPFWPPPKTDCRYSNIRQNESSNPRSARRRRQNQVAFMVRALLGLTETPDADAADALAIALTHLRMQEAAARGVPGGTQI